MKKIFRINLRHFILNVVDALAGSLDILEKVSDRKGLKPLLFK